VHPRILCVCKKHLTGIQKIKVNDAGKERFKLEPISPESEIVKRIFSDYQRGTGVKSILKTLNKEGIPSQVKKNGTRPRFITFCTTNHIQEPWCGAKTSIRKLTPIRVENSWPALVDRTVFDTVATNAGRTQP